MNDSLTIAEACAKSADEIQAEDIVVLDLRGISSLTDFFVICTATSIPHLKAVVRDIRGLTEEAIGESPRSVDGEVSSLWVAIDYVDVVVHVFHSDLRDVYSLENLWADAPRVSFDFLSNSTTSSQA